MLCGESRSSNTASCKRWRKHLRHAEKYLLHRISRTPSQTRLIGKAATLAHVEKLVMRFPFRGRDGIRDALHSEVARFISAADPGKNRECANRPTCGDSQRAVWHKVLIGGSMSWRRRLGEASRKLRCAPHPRSSEHIRDGRVKRGEGGKPGPLARVYHKCGIHRHEIDGDDSSSFAASVLRSGKARTQPITWRQSSASCPRHCRERSWPRNGKRLAVAAVARTSQKWM